MNIAKFIYNVPNIGLFVTLSNSHETPLNHQVPFGSFAAATTIPKSNIFPFFNVFGTLYPLHYTLTNVFDYLGYTFNALYKNAVAG